MANNINGTSKLVEYIGYCHKMAMDYRAQFDDAILTHWESYMNLRQTPEIENQQWLYNDPTPDPFQVAETCAAQNFTAMERTPNWLEVDGASIPGRRARDIVRGYGRTSWYRSHAGTQLWPALKYGKITGTVLGKVQWERRLVEKEAVLVDPFDTIDYEGENAGPRFLRGVKHAVEFNQAQVHFLDHFKVWPDPSGHKSWVIEDDLLDLDMLQWMNSMYRGMLFRNLNKLEPDDFLHENVSDGGNMFVGGNQPGEALWDSLGPQEIVEGIIKPTNPRSVRIRYFSGFVPPRIRDYSRRAVPTQWRFVMLAFGHGETVELRDIPLPGMMVPYFFCPDIPIPNRPYYGESIYKWIESLSNLRSFWENVGREEALSRLFSPIVVDRFAGLKQADLYNRVGGVLELQTMGGDINKVFQRVDLGGVPIARYQESALKLDQINQTAGTTEPFRGEPVGGRATLGEVETLVSVGGARFIAQAIWYDQNLRKEIVRMQYRLGQVFQLEPVIVELAGRGRGDTERVPVSFKDLVWDVDFKIRTSPLWTLDQRMIDTYLAIMERIATLPRAESWVKHEEVLKQLFYLTGDPGAEHNLYTQEEHDDLEAQMAAQQEQQAAFQGGVDAAVNRDREAARAAAQAMGGGSIVPLRGGSA